MSELIGTVNAVQSLTGVLNQNVTVFYQGEQAAIDSLEINSNGQLIVNLVSGTSVSLGVVKGEKGDAGVAGGFGTPTAKVTKLGSGASPTVSVTASGSNSAKIFNFSFGIPKGDQGEPGVIFTPSIDADGNVSWTNNGGLENPQTVNVKGQQGDIGQQGYRVDSIYRKSGTGAPGTTDVYGIRLNDPEGTEVGTFEVYNGANGEGAGDMVQSVYDKDNNGVVDNAEALGGKSPDYYASVGLIGTLGELTTSKKSSIVEAINEVNKFSNAVPTTRTINGKALSEDIELTASDIGAAESEHGTHVTYSTDVPEEDGVASTGLASTVSRSDHKHPSDTSRVPVTRKINGKSLLEDVTLTAEDVGAAEVEHGRHVTYTTSSPTMDGTAHAGYSVDAARSDHKHPSDTSRVPTTRTINNKPLSADITLSASDIGAAETEHGTHVTYSSIAPLMDGSASVGTAGTVARSDHRHPSDTSRVSITRKINNKALSSDITLSASDVGAEASGAVAAHDEDPNAHAELFANIATSQVPSTYSGIVPSAGLTDNTLYVLNLKNKQVGLSDGFNAPHSAISFDLVALGSGAYTANTFFQHIFHANFTYKVTFNTAPLIEGGVTSLSLNIGGQTQNITITSSPRNISLTFTPDSNAFYIDVKATFSSGSGNNITVPTSVEGAFGWAHGQMICSSTTTVSIAGDNKILGDKPNFSTNAIFEFDVVDGVWVFSQLNEVS